MAFNTNSQPRAVCPYCGYEDPDSWDLGWGLPEDDGVTDCPSCEKEYKWLVWTEYRYTTKKIEKPISASEVQGILGTDWLDGKTPEELVREHREGMEW